MKNNLKQHDKVQFMSCFFAFIFLHCPFLIVIIQRQIICLITYPACLIQSFSCFLKSTKFNYRHSVTGN